ncbi:hypothetical protein HAV15_009573 [Penicillium sp. str. |nr:hypothetical protein HAV15_009573 [Penicillium sp. str. \
MKLPLPRGHFLRPYPDSSRRLLGPRTHFSIGLVLSAQKLKPISWREWAGEIERDGGARNPYLSLEERYGFWDIRAKRKEFADWVRGQDVPIKE